MHFLYIDVTSSLIIGLLDSEFNWIDYKDIPEKKPSEIIHLEIYEMLQKHGIDQRKLQYFFSSGPGSYTGMRLGEGMAQILEWGKEKVFSFYHFEVPQLMGVEKGFWITNAFKSQFFIYSWDKEKSESHLINSKDVHILENGFGFTLARDNSLFENLKTSKELIQERPRLFFQKIYDQKMRKAPYYFRTLEEEFK